MKTCLLSLYVSVLIPILSEWNSSEDLCFLDSAVCSQEHRNSFLLILSKCYCTEVITKDSKSIDWLVLRQLHVKKINWEGEGKGESKVLLPVVRSRLQYFRPNSLYELESMLEKSNLNAEEVEVSFGLFSTYKHASLLKTVGSAITHIRCIPFEKGVCQLIAECCPNLRSLQVSQKIYDNALPIVTACQLDTILNCNIGSLLKNLDWTSPGNYRSDLRRVSLPNDTSVSLGLDKHYQLSGLNCYSTMTEEDEQLLYPLMGNLATLKIGSSQSVLFRAAVEKCHLLTELDVWNYADGLQDLVQLLYQSTTLRRFKLETDWPNNCLDVSSYVDVIANRCLRLEECRLINCFVTKMALSLLFHNCACLNVFACSEWDRSTVLNFAVNLNRLEVEYERIDELRKFGRGLIIGGNGDCLEKVMSYNANLRSIKLMFGPSEYLIKVILQSCPKLTSVELTSGAELREEAFRALGSLRLVRFSLHYGSGFTSKNIITLLENQSGLTKLVLKECSVPSDVLTVSARYCRSLTHLDLSRNEDITSSGVISVLGQCVQLQKLILSYCPLVTSEILSSIKSPPLKYLNVYRTSVRRNDLIPFSSINGFTWN